MNIRYRGSNIRRFAVLAAAALLVAFGAASATGCGGQSPDPEFPTPDPHALIPSPGPVTGAPDLSVWIPDGWRAPIKIDEGSLEVSVAWANRGSAMAEDYSIVLTSDGEVVFRWDKPLLAPGSERVEVLSLNDLPVLYPLLQGRHTLELILDPDAAVPEMDRGNNTFSLTREFDFQLPDLRPGPPANANWQGPVVIGGSDLVYGRNDGAAERGYYLAYGVAYHGSERAQAWPQQHSVQVNDYQINQWEFYYELDTPPGPGDVQVHAIPIWKVAVGGRPVLLGNQQFTIIIDESNAVIESDEQNNHLTGQVRLTPSRARTLHDAPDAGGATVHPVYAVPAGAFDEQWDINGTIESIVSDLQTWLRDRTGGRGIIWDEAEGSLDITFVRLEISETELAGSPNSWVPVAEELYRRGLNDPNKVYAVWHPSALQGTSTLICGVRTEYNSVSFSFSFFERVEEGKNICVDQPVTMVHELFHAFGAVAPCATNYVSDDDSLRSAHVDDDPNDLMYSGDRFGIPLELDSGHDDYFGHDIPGCPDTADSPYLGPRS
ncbi:MAG: hypothetical protein IH872_05925 [Chloroflexi bacterium]|nr:hypothetical protein [Chloroflexota bacterium]